MKLKQVIASEPFDLTFYSFWNRLIVSLSLLSKCILAYNAAWGSVSET